MHNERLDSLKKSYLPDLKFTEPSILVQAKLHDLASLPLMQKMKLFTYEELLKTLMDEMRHKNMAIGFIDQQNLWGEFREFVEKMRG